MDYFYVKQYTDHVASQSYPDVFSLPTSLYFSPSMDDVVQPDRKLSLMPPGFVLDERALTVKPAKRGKVATKLSVASSGKSVVLFVYLIMHMLYVCRRVVSQCLLREVLVLPVWRNPIPRPLPELSLNLHQFNCHP